MGRRGKSLSLLYIWRERETGRRTNERTVVDGRLDKTRKDGRTNKRERRERRTCSNYFQFRVYTDPNKYGRIDGKMDRGTNDLGRLTDIRRDGRTDGRTY